MRKSSTWKSSVQFGRWFFGFTLGRFSLMFLWKCDRSFVNYARQLEDLL